MRLNAFHWLAAFLIVSGGLMLSGYAEDAAAPAPAAAKEAPAPAPADDSAPAPDTSSTTTEAPPPAAEQAAGMSVIDIIKAGGIIGYIIIALSVIGFGLILENLYSVRRSVLVPQDIVEEVERLFQEEAYEEALDLCDSEQNLLTNMIGAGLSKIGGGYDAITETMGSALEEGATALHQKVNYLSLIGNISPMMGLLGTVQGMIAAFQQIAASGGTPKPAELADNISLALVTTLLGLIVAIPMVSLHMFLKNRIVKLVLEATAISSELMERFKTS